MKPISVYIHIPFCIRKCTYCNFYSVNYENELVEEYIQSLRKEIKLISFPHEYIVCTLYFGGGSPSLLPFKHLYSIVDAIHSKFPIIDSPEVTLEANPSQVTKTKAKNWRICGINRISLGAQSFQNNELVILGRLHSSNEIYKAAETIRRDCTENLSLDLMYGIPFQNQKSWEKSLESAGEISPMHISSYCLSLEPDTYLGEKREQFDFPDEDTIADMYYKMIDFLASKGYHQYEISNFARPTYKAKHNLTYWQGREYVGFGTAAHSFYNMTRLNNYDDIKKYIEFLNRNELPVQGLRQISREEFISDCIILGLRLNQGISLTRFKNQYNLDILQKYKDTIERLATEGYLTVENDKLKLSRKALFVSNSILSEFI